METNYILEKGQSVLFQEDKLPYLVRCANNKFAICTRKLNRRKDSDILWFEVERGACRTFAESYKSAKDSPIYTIVDLEQNKRGTENLVFCMGFSTDEECQEALERLSKGESEISRRNQIPLIIRFVK